MPGALPEAHLEEELADLRSRGLPCLGFHVRIIDEQLKAVQQYATVYEQLDDAGALSLINAHFDRDTRMNALRQRWLAEFQRVLPARMAARVMQIDRRLSLAAQMELVSQIPLIH